MPSRDDEPIIEIIDLAPEEPINLPWKRILVLLLFLFVGFLVLHNGVPLYTDWLWFREVGYSSVFSTQIIGVVHCFTSTSQDDSFHVSFFGSS